MNDKRKQARLPDSLIGPTIATVKAGRTFYTVPWAMQADEDGLLWLQPDYGITDRPQGTSSMRVELRDDGYHVWPVGSYTRGHGRAFECIPVAVLKGFAGR